MKIIITLFLIITAFLNPSATYASNINLKPCIEVAHCVREELYVESINNPLAKIKEIVEKTPRTKIIDYDQDYFHAEVTSRIMKYVDDLEISYSSENNNLIIRSESRIGEGDFGVNKKRVEKLKKSFFDE